MIIIITKKCKSVKVGGQYTCTSLTCTDSAFVIFTEQSIFITFTFFDCVSLWRYDSDWMLSLIQLNTCTLSLSVSGNIKMLSWMLLQFLRRHLPLSTPNTADTSFWGFELSSGQLLLLIPSVTQSNVVIVHIQKDNNKT